jgi:hypothetical protein
MNTKLLKLAACGAYVAMVACNYLAVLLPLNGRNTGEISDNYPNLFTPAEYAFSIWGVIYALLAIYAIQQLWRTEDALVAQINRLFIINAFLNAFWIVSWHYDFIWLSVVIMAGLLATLIWIAEILRVSDLTKRERWLIQLPFSVYFGWITVAMIANITVFLVSIGWDGFGLLGITWTVVALLVGVLIGSWRMLRDRFIPYGFVLVWAYGAILFAHLSQNGFNGKYPIIIGTVSLCMVVYIGIMGYIYINNRK